MTIICLHVAKAKVRAFAACTVGWVGCRPPATESIRCHSSLEGSGSVLG